MKDKAPHIAALVCAFLALSIHPAQTGSTLRPDRETPEALKKLCEKARKALRREVLAEHPQLAGVTGQELVLALRDLVHRKNKPIGTSPYPGSGLHAYRRLKAGSRYLCSGMAHLFCALSEAFGTPCRLVSFFSALPSETYHSHQAVEVHLGEKWVLMDPTFNIAWKDRRNRYLGAMELERRHRKDGVPPRPVGNGKKVLQSIEDYYLPYEALFAFIEIFTYDCHAFLHSNTVYIEARPRSWYKLLHPTPSS